MSMDNYPQHAETVTNDFVKGQCPEQHNALIDYLKGIGIDDLDSIAFDLDETLGREKIDDVTEEQDERIRELVDELADTFEKKTDLTLYLRYHDAQDKGDEVDGMFWEVDEVWMRTPAGKKYENEITSKGWTVFG